MAHSENWSKLPILGSSPSKKFAHDPITFNEKGLVVQEKSYSEYGELTKIVTETAFNGDTKHIFIRNKTGIHSIKAIDTPESNNKQRSLYDKRKSIISGD